MSRTVSGGVPSHPRHRRGGVYLLVLGMGVMLTVIGLAVATTGRVHARNAATDRNCAEASILASSALDLAAARINGDKNWRNNFGCDAWNPPVPMGNGSLIWKQTDEIDNDVENDPDEPVRLSGEATVAAAARRFSMEARPGGTLPLPVLACTMHGGGGISVMYPVVSSGGAISCNGSLGNSSTITSNVEAGSVVNTGTIAGFVTTPSPAKSVPTVSLFWEYRSQATDISFAGISGGTIDARLLSAAVNPWGPENAAGIYFIRVPAGQSLRIRDSVIQATLVVELGANAEIEVDGLVAWSPPAMRMPSLLAMGPSTATADIEPESGTVNVSAIQANLLGMGINVGVIAAAPSELRGLFHIVGGARTTFEDSPRLIGTWICDGSILVISGSLQMVADPDLVANPPNGYTLMDPTITVVPGSFRWDER